MNKVDVKALSINEAWKGQRYKTDKYKSYEEELLILLPKKIEIPDGLLSVHYVFGVTNMNSDYDNLIKAFQDILQKKYGFNDNRIMRAIIDKVITEKPYIHFSISANEQHS